MEPFVYSAFPVNAGKTFRVLVGKGRAGCPRVASRPWAVIGNRFAVHRGYLSDAVIHGIELL
jgi:hypothetical protein